MNLWKNNRYINYIIRVVSGNIANMMHKIFNNSNLLKANFVDWLFKENVRISKKEYFTEIADDNIILPQNSTKLIAFYLPQYYENEINNKYFGKGFMEWYNTTKCLPQYTGHYQPHLPVDVGFYNLSHDDIMYRQIDLAKKYGIYGFCFYYYWFSGKRLLDKPLDKFLENKDLNMPFCLFWANETWTSIWGNGNSAETIIEQKLLEEDDDKFADDVIKYFKDDRYIKIEEKPLLIIYLSRKFAQERFNRFLHNLREKVKAAGFKGIHIMTTDCRINGELNIDGLNFDSIVEFSHMNFIKYGRQKEIDMKGKYINPYFKGHVFDIKYALKEKHHLTENKCKTFRCVAAGWDNSPRKAFKNADVYDMTPKEYKIWLEDSITWTEENLSDEEQFVFIDSWNEWAEGAHLEPDQKYGYAYLQETKNVLERLFVNK